MSWLKRLGALFSVGLRFSGIGVPALGLLPSVTSLKMETGRNQRAPGLPPPIATAVPALLALPAAEVAAVHEWQVRFRVLVVFWSSTGRGPLHRKPQGP